MSLMELNENFDFLQTCRLCLSQNKELISVFNKSSFGLEYSIIVSECTDVMVTENDELPNIICLECVDCLNKFYHFRKLVVNSELRLNEYLNRFRNNLYKYVKIVNIDNIKQENLDNDFSEKPTTCSLKINEDSNSFEEYSDFEHKNEIVKEELEIDENLTFSESTFVSNSEENHKTIGFDVIKTIFNCKSCPQTFTNETDLNEHKQIHQKTNQHNSTSTSHLARLKKPNKNEKRVSCAECGKSYKRLDNLKEHQRLHTGKKLYVCKHCNKPFTNESHFKEHERVHTGEKPYSCNQCEKTFISYSNLKRHNRVHTGERPFICKYCEKSFASSSNLKEHERIHTGETPFICNQCGESFSQMYNLKAHTLIHTGVNYICDQCGKSFGLLVNLKKHIQRHRVKT